MEKTKWRYYQFENDVDRAKNYARAMGVKWAKGKKTDYEFAQEVFEMKDRWEEEHQMEIMDAFEF